jgi:hypothetical protein
MTTVSVVAEQLATDVRDWKAIAQALSTADANQVRPLTTELFARQPEHTSPRWSDDEAQKLLALADFGSQLQLTPRDTDFANRLVADLNLAPTQAVEFARAGLEGYGEFAQVALDSAANYVPPLHALDLVAEYPRRLPDSLRAFHRPFENSNLWAQRPAVAEEVINTVLAERLLGVEEVVSAASFGLGSDSKWRELQTALGNRFVFASARIAALSPALPIPVSSWTAFVAQRDAILSALESAAGTPGFLSEYAPRLDPRDPVVAKHGLKPWEPLLAELFEPRLDLATFVLVLALKTMSDPLSIRAINTAFGIVFRAAAADRLPREVGALLASELPSIGFWRDWDVCERLRRIILERAVENWTLGELAPTIEVGSLSDWIQSVGDLHRSKRRKKALADDLARLRGANP